jgi:hypothetical protein
MVPDRISRESDVIREARLKRFGQMSNNVQSRSMDSQPHRKRDSSTPIDDKWECTYLIEILPHRLVMWARHASQMRI